MATIGQHALQPHARRVFVRKPKSGFLLTPSLMLLILTSYLPLFYSLLTHVPIYFLSRGCAVGLVRDVWTREMVRGPTILSEAPDVL